MHRGRRAPAAAARRRGLVVAVGEAGTVGIAGTGVAVGRAGLGIADPGIVGLGRAGLDRAGLDRVDLDTAALGFAGACMNCCYYCSSPRPTFWCNGVSIPG